MSKNPEPRTMTRSDWVEVQAEMAGALVEYWAAEKGIRVWKKVEGGQEYTEDAQGKFNSFYDIVEGFMMDMLGDPPDA